MSPASIHADAAEIIKQARRLAPGLDVLYQPKPLDAATVVAAPAVDVPLDVLLVIGQGLIFRHAYFLRCRVEALAGVGRLLNLGGKIRHEGYLLFHVPAGAQAAV